MLFLYLLYLSSFLCKNVIWADPLINAAALSLPLGLSAIAKNEEKLLRPGTTGSGRSSRPEQLQIKQVSSPGQSISYVTTSKVLAPGSKSTSDAISWMANRFPKDLKQLTQKPQAFKILSTRYTLHNRPTTRFFINEPHKDDAVVSTQRIVPRTDMVTKKVVINTTPRPTTLTTDYENRRRCQNKNGGSFYPSATTCMNERSDRICSYLFSAPDPVTGKRDPKCSLAGMEDIANSCRKQCAICCEHIDYACEDDHNNIIACSKQLDKCQMAKWFDVLSKFCAGSCGLCTKTECRDYNVNCREMKDQCLESDKIDEMRDKCARTCGFCVVGGNIGGDMPFNKPAVPQCIDRAPNCTNNEHLCASPIHAEFMIKFCAKTCFKCTLNPNVIVPVIGTPHDINGTAAVLMPASVIINAAAHNSKICEDRHPKCSIWVSKGFCIHEKYTVEQRRALCPKSCKLC